VLRALYSYQEDVMTSNTTMFEFHLNKNKEWFDS